MHYRLCVCVGVTMNKQVVTTLAARRVCDAITWHFKIMTAKTVYPEGDDRKKVANFPGYNTRFCCWHHRKGEHSLLLLLPKFPLFNKLSALLSINAVISPVSSLTQILVLTSFSLLSNLELNPHPARLSDPFRDLPALASRADTGWAKTLLTSQSLCSFFLTRELWYRS